MSKGVNVLERCRSCDIVAVRAESDVKNYSLVETKVYD